MCMSLDGRAEEVWNKNATDDSMRSQIDRIAAFAKEIAAEAVGEQADALAKAEKDIHAYRGALGYHVPGCHDGRLSDGTTPQCGMCDASRRHCDAAQVSMADERAKVERLTKKIKEIYDTLSKEQKQ